MSSGLRDVFGSARRPERAGLPHRPAGAEPGADGGRRGRVDAVGKITAGLEVVEKAWGINGR